MIKAVIFDCYGVMLDIFNNTKEPRMIAFVHSLRATYKTGMVSNVSGRASLDAKFADGELDELFDAVIPSGDVGVEKPDPEIFRLAAERLGVAAEECLFIDDISEYVAAAQAVGMQGVHHVDPEVTIATVTTVLGGAHER